MLLGLTLLVIPVSQAPSKRPCTQMAKKICTRLGFDAFFCQTYVKVARHRNANQNQCSLLMKNKWRDRLAVLQRQEEIIKKMKLISESNPIRMQQFQTYQKNLAKKTIHGMLKSGKRTTRRISPRACQILATKACKDLGTHSFYCGVFLAAGRSRHSKPSKCYVLLKNWNTSQLANYAKREKFLLIMSNKARTRRQKRQVLRIRRSQKSKILNYLRR